MKALAWFALLLLSWAAFGLQRQEEDLSGLEPGLERARAYAEALREAHAAGDSELYGERIQAAFQIFVADVEGLRIEAAEVLAVAMHETAQATWSAVSLALWSTRMGKHERADRVLAALLETTSEPMLRLDLLQRRGIAAIGAGNMEAARDHLGRAMILGGTDAAQILARMALAEGQNERAARLFGGLLTPTADEDPLVVTPWALRGWGMALLPPE